MNSEEHEKINILKILSDPSRYTIVKILMNSDGDVCVNEIAEHIKITPSAVSHQLAKLEKLSIVKPIRRGQTVCYKIRKNRASRLLREIILVLQ
ncbi:winged helix-turn-helix transcriptional regulator [Candidatus Nomurabacteria bacterium]|uniref:Winged helix-turn-helix transcriptional regulator n=1 Tax=Candidatus Dojkabacteria bacterium TaxID=2099670 RepID=A0A955HZW9_9BACT|nr:winged helix-turn-helix transcriptional regulator [Candidatus Dojkabacteria bacterium]MCB9790072.1 winged helix-turn-helix transcriptional regulator [Candidatus Nomurabacteria bacterium]